MFRTELSIDPATGQLPRTARVLTLGSCFADSIGARLVASKVETLVNPFGTVFQPLALARLLRAAAGEEVDWQQHLVEARGRWQSYDLHGSLGADSPVALLQTIQELVHTTGEFLRQADVVLLTLGTAWAYRLRETGELASNCHKQPADLFARELLTPDEIINALAETHAYLRRINPALRFVLTVSPVRHLKDTLPLNSVSKSVLRLATHIVSDLLPDVAYFPAYELLMDDLRDYRFYASDMLHPTAVAEDYVWEKFARTYFDADFGRFRKEWAAVQQALEHRPLHAGAPEHRQFLESTREKLEQLSLRKVEVRSELAEVRARLSALPVPAQPALALVAEDEEERVDIGEDAAATASAAVAVASPPAPAAERSPRLSPEAFRAQRAARPERGRRDGRGRGPAGAPTENEQFQTAALAGEAGVLPPAELQPLAAVAEVIVPTALPMVLKALDLELVDAGGEAAKKKKRRSRGGAKRTARKNALRLAAGEADAGPAPGTVPGGVLPADVQGLSLEAQSAPPETKKSSVITKSAPVKRSGRRDESNRVPRVPLFAAETATPAPNAPAPPNAELPALPVAPAAVAPMPEPDDTLIPEAGAAAGNPRNSRNRKRKGASRSETAPPSDGAQRAPEAAAALASRQEAARPIGTGDAPADAPNDNRGEQSRPALPTAESKTGSGPAGTAPAPVAARQPRRAKARLTSAARTEKPAVDTPIIPAPDAAAVRTQVAAGRLTGASASLVAPTGTPKKVIATKKAVVPAKAVARPAKAAMPAVSAAVEDSVGMASPKAKAVPKPRAAPAAQPAPPAAKAPAARPKAAPLASPASPKLTAAKPPKAEKPTAPPKKAVPKVDRPKASAAKPAAPKKTVPKPTAEKPKPARKPTKPA